METGAQFCANCGANVSHAQGSLATEMVKPPRISQEMQDAMLSSLREAALGEYEILAELGRGGMATVYLGHDLALDRKVAIKVMLPELLRGEGMIDRFKLEARTSAQLSHPHIIPIFAVRDTEQLLFFVMKFVEGRPLDSICAELGKMPIKMAQSILSKVGEALGYAHRRGVIHRDIKPANIMVDVEGQPVVTDFGIAKVAESKGLTMTGATVGTPTYMSPEQCMAEPITGASDQYSLGVVGYQMLTGRTPFGGDNVVALLYKHVHEAPAPFMQERPDCPRELHDVIMRMLAKKPEERFPHLEAAVQAMGAVTLAFDDPVRTQLTTLAKHGANLKVLKRVSTPMSPTPSRSRVAQRGAGSSRVQSTRQGTAAQSAAQGAATQLAPSMQTTAVAPSRAPLWIAASILIAGGGIAAAVLHPWDKGANLQQTAAPPAAAPAAAPVEGTAAATPDAGAPPASAAQPSASPPAGSKAPAGRAPRGTDRNAAAPPPAAGPHAASVTVSSVSGALLVGATTRLTATVLGDDGRPMGVSIVWRSDNTSVATVSDGLVTAVGAGVTLVIASAEGHEGSATIRVNAPEAPRAAPPAAAPVQPAAPTVAPREAATAIVQEYARALESRQINLVRRVYPTMTADQENRTQQTFQMAEQLQVRLQMTSFEQDGDNATAAVAGEYQLVDRESHRTIRLPVRFQFLLENAQGWHIKTIRDLR